MHSACETAGVYDAKILESGMKAFYDTKIKKEKNCYIIK